MLRERLNPHRNVLILAIALPEKLSYMNMLPYAGFPAVQNGMTVSREVFQSRNTNRER